ncbi:cupin domain-containing protein [Aliidongia dinghuensis]|uniref:cupin domain-containing protein n=1 Tax=Aliidongia dinghuensis TaxID=1867774 RepID=UPI003898F08F
MWECQPGGWPVHNRPDTEVAFILSGTATITDATTGIAHTVTAGDLVVLPPGWTGRWDVTETVRKVYAIF